MATTASWVEITDFPKIGDFYNGDIVRFGFSGGGRGHHAGPRQAHFRPGELYFWRVSDADSKDFQMLVMSGRTIPKARFVQQWVDGDTVTNSRAVYLENLSSQSMATASREGMIVDDLLLSYTWVDVAYS
jgi:hypothetical protein